MLISDERQLAHLPAAPWVRVSAPTSIREPLVARQVNRLAPDVVFSPMQTMGTWGRRYQVLLTLHDLIYYRHRTPPPEFAAPIRLLWRLYHLAWWPQRLLLNRADAVVTVSETSAALIATHRLTRRPVTVVPNAADPRARPAQAAAHPRAGLHGHVHAVQERRDARARGRAAARPRAAPHEPRSPPPTAPGSPRSAPAPRLVFHDGADDATYRDVLRGATALVSASRDEGFGLPLVEAMGVGTPLVVSDIPVFREVGGDAAAYVDPDDARGLRRGRSAPSPTTRPSRRRRPPPGRGPSTTPGTARRASCWPSPNALRQRAAA